MAKLRRRGSTKTSKLAAGDGAYRKDNRGSKPGEMRGPGRKGRPNRKTLLRIAAFEDSIISAGTTPLEFMLAILRTKMPKELDGRDMGAFLSMQLDAAKAAAPYCHARKADTDQKPAADRASEIRAIARAMMKRTGV